MRINNRVLLTFVFLFLCVIILENSYFLIKINSIGHERMVTAKAMGNVKFCNNHPPVINFTCNGSVEELQTYTCQMTATDDDNDTIIFSGFPLQGVELFNVTSDGYFEFTPNETQIGTYDFGITAWDDSGCPNGIKTEGHSINITDINDPPVLIEPIPNQTWNQDSSLTPFSLDTFFWDPDNDPLTYTFTLPSYIEVVIGNDSTVTFIPDAGWFGVEKIIFFAWDPHMANASSNEVVLDVKQKQVPPVEPPPPQEDKKSSGGGGGGSNPPLCMPKWYCRPWAPCTRDNTQSRDCYDLNNCSTSMGKPNTTQPCKWFSTCYDGVKGPEEEGVDCGGPCSPCGDCSDNVCNNNEDCLKQLSTTPDCGGPCKPCAELKETDHCTDGVCNGDEDCMSGITDIPDCGGSCEKCPLEEEPKQASLFDWPLLILLILMAALLAYLVSKSFTHMKAAIAKKKKKTYEERLLLEAKIAESIFDSLLKLEDLLSTEDIQKLIVLFATIMRRYFKSLFKLTYEFTYEELMAEINAKNISPTLKVVLKNFFERSTEIEFSGKSVSKEELRALISEFKQIVASTSEGAVLKDEKVMKEHVHLNKMDKMFFSISQAESCLRKEELNSAFQIYMELLKEYKDLPEKDQKRIQGYIARLYEEIKFAREKFNSPSQENTSQNNSNLYKQR